MFSNVVGSQQVVVVIIDKVDIRRFATFLCLEVYVDGISAIRRTDDSFFSWYTIPSCCSNNILYLWRKASNNLCVSRLSLIDMHNDYFDVSGVCRSKITRNRRDVKDLIVVVERKDTLDVAVLYL